MSPGGILKSRNSLIKFCFGIKTPLPLRSGAVEKVFFNHKVHKEGTKYSKV
jgi:hypothetical protein